MSSSQEQLAIGESAYGSKYAFSPNAASVADILDLSEELSGPRWRRVLKRLGYLGLGTAAFAVAVPGGAIMAVTNYDPITESRSVDASGDVELGSVDFEELNIGMINMRVTESSSLVRLEESIADTVGIGSHEVGANISVDMQFEAAMGASMDVYYGEDSVHGVLDASMLTITAHKAQDLENSANDSTRENRGIWGRAKGMWEGGFGGHGSGTDEMFSEMTAAAETAAIGSAVQKCGQELAARSLRAGIISGHIETVLRAGAGPDAEVTVEIINIPDSDRNPLDRQRSNIDESLESARQLGIEVVSTDAPGECVFPREVSRYLDERDQQINEAIQQGEL